MATSTTSSPALPAVFTLEEAAKLLNIPTTTLRKQVRDRVVQHRKTNGRGATFTQEDIDRIRGAIQDEEAARRAAGDEPSLQLYRPEEAAEILRISRATIYKLLKEDAIPYRQLPNAGARFTRDDLLAILEGARRGAISQ